MANEVSRKQLDVYEVRNDDGGVGILIGGTNAIHMGYDEEDVKRLLRAVFLDIEEGGTISPSMGELADAAERYLASGQE